MDTRHRHELEQNDLLSFFGHFGQWWEKYGMGILVVALVVVGGFTAKRYYDAHIDNARDSAYRDLETATSPDAYRSVARDSTDPNIQMLAYLRGADLALAHIVTPEAPAPPSTQPSRLPIDLLFRLPGYSRRSRRKALGSIFRTRIRKWSVRRHKFVL